MKELKELKNGTYFQRVRKNGQVMRTMWVKEYYSPSERAYWCSKFEDINDGRFFKGNTIVDDTAIF